MFAPAKVPNDTVHASLPCRAHKAAQPLAADLLGAGQLHQVGQMMLAPGVDAAANHGGNAICGGCPGSWQASQ